MADQNAPSNGDGARQVSGESEGGKTGRGVPTGPRSASGNIPTGPRDRSAARDAPQVSAQPQNEASTDVGTSEPVGSASSSAVPPENETDPTLPDGWTKTMSRTHGKYFYFHEASGATQWQAPTAADTATTNTTAGDNADQAQSYPSPKSKSPSPIPTTTAGGGFAAGPSKQGAAGALTASSSNGTVGSSTEKRVPDGPSRGRDAIPAGPRGGSGTAPTRGPQGGRDVQLNRAPLGPSGSGPRDLVRRRSASPGGRNDSKRPRAEEPRRASPPPSSSVSIIPRRDIRDDRSTRDPPRTAPIVTPARPVDLPTRGANNAPLTNNRWNAKPPAGNEIADHRAALAERRRKAEEELKQIQHEENELDRVIADAKRKKQEEDDRQKKADEDRKAKAKVEEERKKKMEEEKEKKWRADRDADRRREGLARNRVRDGWGPEGRSRQGDLERMRRSPPPIRNDRPPSPGRRRIISSDRGDSYRPPSSPPRSGLSSRLARGNDFHTPNGGMPLPPRRLSPPPIGPRRSPPPMGGRRSPPPMMRRRDSPPLIRRGGEPYRDDFGGPRPYAEPMSEQARRGVDDRRGPPLPPMRGMRSPPGRPRSPPPGRSLVERMSRPPQDGRRW